MYGYGYGYNTPAFGIGASAGIFVTLLVIAFIAAIVLAVAGYRKYVDDGDQQHFSLKDSSTWGPFFRFDKLVIDKILKALYLFCAILPPSSSWRLSLQVWLTESLRFLSRSLCARFSASLPNSSSVLRLSR